MCAEQGGVMAASASDAAHTAQVSVAGFGLEFVVCTKEHTRTTFSCKILVFGTTYPEAGYLPGWTKRIRRISKNLMLYQTLVLTAGLLRILVENTECQATLTDVLCAQVCQKYRNIRVLQRSLVLRHKRVCRTLRLKKYQRVDCDADASRSPRDLLDLENGWTGPFVVPHWVNAGSGSGSGSGSGGGSDGGSDGGSGDGSGDGSGGGSDNSSVDVQYACVEVLVSLSSIGHEQSVEICWKEMSPLQQGPPSGWSTLEDRASFGPYARMNTGLNTRLHTLPPAGPIHAVSEEHEQLRSFVREVYNHVQMRFAGAFMQTISVQVLLPLNGDTRMYTCNMWERLPRFLQHCCTLEDQQSMVNALHLHGIMPQDLQFFGHAALEEGGITDEATQDDMLAAIHEYFPPQPNSV